jgi:hypothetical protein
MGTGDLSYVCVLQDVNSDGAITAHIGTPISQSHDLVLRIGSLLLEHVVAYLPELPHLLHAIVNACWRRPFWQ